MNFFKHSGRVPLVMAGPKVAKGAVNSPCSLVDILPTMIDIAAQTGCEKPEMGQPIDGRSLWPWQLAMTRITVMRLVNIVQK